jgi:hypothetical protein
MDGDLRALLASEDTTVDGCESWLSTASEGQVLVYHRGALAPARNLHGEALGEHARRNLGGVARCLWLAAQRGRVHLLQRRIADGHFEYLAVARLQAPHRSACPNSNSPQMELQNG